MMFDMEHLAAMVRRVKTEHPRVTCELRMAPADAAGLTDYDRRLLASVDVPVVTEAERVHGRCEVHWHTATGAAPGEEHMAQAP